MAVDDVTDFDEEPPTAQDIAEADRHDAQAAFLEDKIKKKGQEDIDNKTNRIQEGTAPPPVDDEPIAEELDDQEEEELDADGNPSLTTFEDTPHCRKNRANTAAPSSGP